MLKSVLTRTVFRPRQFTRSLRVLDFGDGVGEEVHERSDYPLDSLREEFKNDKFVMLGYGTQGRGQALNLRDNGFDVSIGLRPGRSWDLAVEDGFQPMEINEAIEQGSIIMYLLSDAGQKKAWDDIKPLLTPGKTLYFSHGFSIVYSDLTGVIPPEGVDTVLVAPKGSGTTVRRLFLEGRGINASVAVHQDASGRARERAFKMGAAVGAGYMYETSFQKETYSDLTGERGVLMGAIQGFFQAQYNVLRKRGHSPSEAFNETVEEATQSLYPLIGENGMDWMYANCSTTAQRGALDWCERFRECTEPVFEELYDEVAEGSETRRVLLLNSRVDYKENLEIELQEMRDNEMWRAGQVVRSLRPERQI